MTTAIGDACPGPLIWFPVSDADDSLGAVLECTTCGHLTTTGNFNDPRHAYTPMLSEGLAT